jgi:hypothetical protein
MLWKLQARMKQGHALLEPDRSQDPDEPLYPSVGDRS